MKQPEKYGWQPRVLLDQLTGKFRTFDLKIINFLKLWRVISRLILDVERSFNHQNDHNNLKNTFSGLKFTLKRPGWRKNVVKHSRNNLNIWNLSVEMYLWMDSTPHYVLYSHILQVKASNININWESGEFIHIIVLYNLIKYSNPFTKYSIRGCKMKLCPISIALSIWKTLFGLWYN